MEQESRVLRLGSFGAFLVAASILVASVLFSLSRASATSEPAEALRDIHEARGFWLAAHLAFIAISFFLAPVIPAMYLAHRETHPAAARLGSVAWVAAIPAGVLPAALAIALIPLADRFAGQADRAAALIAAEAVRMSILVSFGALGILVGGGTLLFGLAILRAAWPAWVGWLGVVGGLLFAVGAAVPPLIILFVVANLIGIVWFFLVGVRLSRLRASA